MEAELTQGRSVDAKGLQERVDRIGSLLNARDELMRGRRQIFYLLLALSLASVGASSAPDLVLWHPVTLKISRTTASFLRPVCKSCRTIMALQASYDMGKWRCPKCGQEAESEIVRFVPVGSNAQSS